MEVDYNVNLDESMEDRSDEKGNVGHFMQNYWWTTVVLRLVETYLSCSGNISDR